MTEPINFGALIEPVARALWGEPNGRLSKPDELRWGNQGARIVYPTRGAFKDTEANHQGGTLELLHHVEGLDRPAAMEWLASKGLIPANGEAPRRRENAVFLAPGQQIVATFRFEKGGRLHYRKHRIEPGREGRTKEFAYDHADGNGGWRSKRGPAPEIPYGVDTLGRDGPVLLLEGEAKVDKAVAWGFPALSLKDWRAGFSEYVVGRQIVELPDNDPPGRQQVASVHRMVEPVAATVITIELPGLPHAGDIIDWTGTADELRALVDAALNQSIEGAEPLPGGHDPAEWDGRRAPDRRYVLPGWLIRGSAGLLGGEDGVGKSLLAQQMATCAAAGLPFLGLPVEPTKAIYITCEDDPDELWRRQEAINAALGLTMAQLRGRLKVHSLKGHIGNELASLIHRAAA